MMLSKALVQLRNNLPKLPGKGIAWNISKLLVNYNELAGIKALASIKPSSLLVAHNPDTILFKITTSMSVAKNLKDDQFCPHRGLC